MSTKANNILNNALKNAPSRTSLPEPKNTVTNLSRCPKFKFLERDSQGLKIPHPSLRGTLLFRPLL
jgi:hypothetical protein